MTTKEKILQYIDYKGISKRDFYRQTGLSNGFLDSGKHIGSDNLKIIISNYPEISLEWLVMDSGEMLVDNKKPNVQKRLHNESVTQSVTKSVTNEKFKKGYT
ncbi:transcriptional regulator, partial [Ornithobacterium rhinotracheale]|uniref:transcriptional regulator n=1 Tax=Ornithobacterium rhinotracheale TaxID=28251 RepID=UPI00129D1B03